MPEMLIELKNFIGFIVKRFSNDKCSSVAAELTVTTLLALVPLVTLFFSILSMVPNFQNMGVQIQGIIFEYFVPATSESVQQYLLEFVSKTKSMSWIGSLMLLVTALMMMRTIDSSFNNIWQIKRTHSALKKFLIYWAILTLGPLLLGSSLAITSYLASIKLLTDAVQGTSQWLTLGLPFVLETITFGLIFFVIPNRKIRVKDASVAALVTAVLFEFAKYGFTVFVKYFSTYQVIFGALASIPIFIIWLYLSWNIVLLGAEICHGLFSYKIQKNTLSMNSFIETIRVLDELSSQQDKESLTQHKSVEVSANNIQWLEQLVDVGIVAKLEDQSYCLKICQSDIDYQLIYNVAQGRLPNIDELQNSGFSDDRINQLSMLIESFDELLATKLISEQFR